MAQRALGLGVDFGTSNTAAGFVQDGRPRLISFAPGQTTIPTTFFFDFDTRKMLIGDPANEALLEGAEGRFMRALKRILGTPLMHEPGHRIDIKGESMRRKSPAPGLTQPENPEIITEEE